MLKRIVYLFVVLLIGIGLISCTQDAVKHTVTFANTTLDSIEVVEGEKLVKPNDPTQDNHEFINWFSDVELTILFDFNQVIEEDLTIYAKFDELVSELTHIVAFENTTLDDVVVIEGKKVVKPSDPIQDGHAFVNWYTDTNFTVVFDFDQIIDADTTIYARFDEIVFEVDFANTELNNIDVAYGNQVVKPNNPEIVGYEFYDWYMDAEFTMLFDFDQVITEDKTLYAKFGLTISHAIDIANALQNNTSTNEKYFLAGTIKSISNIEFGNMVITNGTEDFTIFGVFSSDGSDKYQDLVDKPVVGDKVYLYGVLNKYNENLELKNSWLISMEKAEIPVFDATDYTEMTIAQSREADVDDKVIVEGVVSIVTFANAMSPNGLFLVDETGSIYIYDYDIAASVTAGDTIKVAGLRTNFILPTEMTQAEKLGYDGAIQLAEVTLVEHTVNDLEYNKDWIESVTIKDLLATDPSEKNITGNIYKVNAFINEVPGLGFTNFYVNDLDETTGSYAYSMNNGNDFSWLRAYDGQLKTVYVAVINAKSTTNGLIYRFVPVTVGDDFEYNQDYNPTFAVKYYGVDQFLDEYFFSPDQELLTSISSTELGISNVTLGYASNDTDVVFFEEVEGDLVFKIGLPGTAIVTITGTDGTNTYFETVEITVLDKPGTNDIQTVAEAIAEDDETVVVIEGVVAASLVNKSGFYLIDETGVIAVEMLSSEVAKLELGNLVVITGIKTHAGKTIDDDTQLLTAVGQIAVREATIVANKFGSHDFSTATFQTGSVLSDLENLDKLEDHSTEVYVIDATIVFTSTAYYSLYSLEHEGAKMNIYAGSTSQLAFLEPFQGEEVSIEFTVVNWNGKKYSGSIISVTFDGVKTVNNSNFND